MDIKREYKAIVWTRGDTEKPGQRVTVQAEDPAEARKLLVERFGEDIACSIWNDEDADKTR